MSSISSVSGQVAVAVGFLTRDLSLIWNTEHAILFQRLLLKLESQTHFNSMCFSFAAKLSVAKGVEESKLKIKNSISKK